MSSHTNETTPLSAFNTTDKKPVHFPTPCPACGASATTHLVELQLPHFGRTLLLSTQCGACGFSSNETKRVEPVPDMGTSLILVVRDDQDLQRDVVKGEMAGIRIPELDLELVEGGLGGVYTTVEGLVVKMKERLQLTRRPKLHSICDALDAMADGQELPFSLIIRDPLSSSFIGPRLGTEGGVNADVLVEHHTRTAEDNERLGLDDCVET